MNNRSFTQLIEFEIEPRQQPALVTALSRQTERLAQRYDGFVSASVQDLLRRYLKTHSGFEQLPHKVSIHLNDTHPVLAVPELMRLLVDEHGLEWDAAWKLCQRVFSYTNHTLMHEALETWPVELLGRVLPRHLRIILDINAGLLAELTAHNGDDIELMRRVSLIDEQGERVIEGFIEDITVRHATLEALEHAELRYRHIFEHASEGIFQTTREGQYLAANPALARIYGYATPQALMADLSDIEIDNKLNLSFKFRLDVSHLPRPFQMMAGSQAEWNLSAQKMMRLSADLGR